MYTAQRVFQYMCKYLNMEVKGGMLHWGVGCFDSILSY